MIHCTLCHTPLLNRIDDQFFGCTTCGGLVKHPDLFPGWQEEKERYLLHNNDVNDPNYQRFTAPISDFVIKHYSAKDKGLDFGSGTGPVITRVLRDSGYDIDTYDPFFAPDEAVLQRTYDYIASCEVFEHFFDPCREITRLRGLLKAGGRLIVMTLLYHDHIDFENWFYRKDMTHVFIYRPETFRHIAASFNFCIEQMTSRLIVLRKE